MYIYIYIYMAPASRRVRKCGTALEAFQVLGGAARGGPSRLGSFGLEEFDASFSSPIQGTPFIRHPELLPLPEAASAPHLALWRCVLSDTAFAN